MLHDRLTGWMRPVAALLVLAGTLALSACGGGSGSVNNPSSPNQPDPIASLQLLPSGIITAYSGIPTTINILGGLAPYTAVSNDSAVLPVPVNVAGSSLVLVANAVSVGADVPVQITVADQSGQKQVANIIVRFAPLFQNGLTITPSNTTCGLNVCDGDTATVTVVATGVGGAPLPGRQIRFDAVFGPFAIMTSNPGTPLAPTLTVVTDGTGTATVQILATANAPTQAAQIRATDVATGQTQNGNFVVERTTNGDNLSVIPPSATIQTLYNNSCSSGFLVDYYIFGGVPPYTITASFPTAVTFIPNVVAASGGFFRASTNGTCANPVTFAIVDSAGKTITAALNNIPGSLTPPSGGSGGGGTGGGGAAQLVVTPNSAGPAACLGQTFGPFVVTGGTPPYNIQTLSSVAGDAPAFTPSPFISSAGGSVSISGLGATVGNRTFRIYDNGIPTQSGIVTVSCN